jgi:excisionase family DNA binding protein
MSMQNTVKDRAPLHRRAYSLAEVAQILGVHKATIYRSLYRGDLKPMAGLGRARISDVELDRFLNATKN